jgi:hypothetical protein
LKRLPEAGNFIGGGLETIKQLAGVFETSGDDVRIDSTTPNSTRPWQHVVQPLFGYFDPGYEFDSGDKPKCGVVQF